MKIANLSKSVTALLMTLLLIIMLLPVGMMVLAWAEPLSGEITMPNLTWSTPEQLNFTNAASVQTLEITTVYSDESAASVLLREIDLQICGTEYGESDSLNDYFELQGVVEVYNNGQPREITDLDALVAYINGLNETGFTFGTATYKIKLQPTAKAYGMQFTLQVVVRSEDGSFDVTSRNGEPGDGWTALTVDMPTYTLTYDANGGSGELPVDENSPYTYGETMATVLDGASLTRANHTFLGWSTNRYAAEAAYTEGDSFELTANTTLYAIWKNNGGGNSETGTGSGGAPSTDIDDPDTPLDAAPALADHFAYLLGYPDGTVRPNAYITRAEAATVFFRLLDDDVREANRTGQNAFTDVSAGDWYNNAVSVMSKLGVINGYEDGAFRPNGSISRAELAAMATRFSGRAVVAGGASFTDTAGHWAEGYTIAVSAEGWVQGYADGSFKPNRPITRAEFVTVINRMLERLPKGAEDVDREWAQTWTDNTDKTAWYYTAIQEATNSHYYEYYKVYVDKNADGEVYEDEDGRYYKYELMDGFKRETWTAPRADRDWAAIENP